MTEKSVREIIENWCSYQAVRVSCPDGKPGCLVIHYGSYCGRCSRPYKEHPTIDKTLAQLRAVFKGEKKKNICEEQLMCMDDTFPVYCLYDKPEGTETCLSMDRDIPKEKCDAYKSSVIREENYDQHNEGIDVCIEKCR